MPPQPPPAPYGQRGGTATSAITRRLTAERRAGEYPSEQRRAQLLGAAAINEALRFMDPTTRGQFMRQMARDYPKVFGAYGAVETPAPVVGEAGRLQQEQLLTPQRLGQAIRALRPGAIAQALATSQKPVTKAISQGRGAPLQYLQDYLRTAQQAYGTGVGRATRAERAYSEQRLRELEEQSQQRPDFGLMAQLGQALVNPAIGKAPASGGLGTYRATATPQRKPMRGGMFRAESLT